MSLVAQRECLVSKVLPGKHAALHLVGDRVLVGCWSLEDPWASPSVWLQERWGYRGVTQSGLHRLWGSELRSLCF